MKKSKNQQAWVLALALSLVSCLIILSSVNWGVWTSWTQRSLIAFTVYNFYLWYLLRINFMKKDIEIRGNTISFLRIELPGNNTRWVLFIGREGNWLRYLINATGHFFAGCHRCPEIAPSVNKHLLSINFCACAKHEGYNLLTTQSHGREENKTWFVNIYCFNFSEKLSPLPISGNYIPPFFPLGTASLLSPLPKGEVKVLTRRLFMLVRHSPT